MEISKQKDGVGFERDEGKKGNRSKLRSNHENQLSSQGNPCYGV